MRVNEKMRKALSILLCLCMLLQNAPVMAFAAAEDNLCAHHSAHTADCGYAAASAGSDCTHVHDVLCGYVAAVAGADCAHVHDEACGYAPAIEGHECTFACEECKAEEAHTHVYDGEAQYAQKDDAVHTVTRACTSCEEQPTQTVEEAHAYAEGFCVCGKAEPVHTHVYVEGICECGAACEHIYAEGVCTVCSMAEPVQEPQVLTITAWSWVDDYEIIDPDYMDAVIPGVGAENPIDWETLVEFLPSYITAQVNGEEVELPVTWECETFPEAATGGKYTVKAILPVGYVLGEDVTALEVDVDLGTVQQYAITPTKPANGDGSESNPYQITSADELYWFAEYVNDGNASACAKLMDDITVNENVIVNGALNSDTSNLVAWTPIGVRISSSTKAFRGIFDGGNHTISGLYVSAASGYQGLIGFMESATVKNVTVANSYFSGTTNIGAVVGCYGAEGVSTVTNCHNVGSVVIGSNYYVGGIVGGQYAPATYNAQIVVSDCSNSGSVTGAQHYVGGIIGYAEYFSEGKAISNCTNTGTVTNTSTSRAQGTGGIAGYFGGSSAVKVEIVDCTNSGTIQITEGGKQDYMGGIIGQNSNGHISDCNNRGTISGYQYAGGIVGSSSGTVSKCSNTGSVSGTEAGIGGIAGRNSGTVTACTNNGSVQGGRHIGGIIGSGIGTGLSDCTNTGGVTSNTYGVGGVIGYVDAAGTVENCHNEGDVKGTYYIGGLVGHHYTGAVTYTECSNKGAVEGSSQNVGGLFGRIATGSTAKECYNEGNVSCTGTYNKQDNYGVGGLAGTTYNAVKFEDCYNTGSVDGGTNTYVGGLVGFFHYASGSTENYIKRSHNTGSVTGGIYTGGLVGIYKSNGVSEECYNIGSVNGKNYVGGLVGYHNSSGSEKGIIKNCYNTGSVTGSMYVGGLYGNSFYTNTLETSYNIGTVSGSSYVGSVIGNKQTIFNCYYLDTSVTNGNTVTGATAMTVEQMTDDANWQTNFAGFDATNVWSKDTNAANTVYFPKLDSYSPALHVHSWTYTASDANSDGVNDTITAGCNAAGCTESNGGSVTIAAPDELVYSGSSMDAVCTYTDWLPDKVDVSYNDIDRVNVTGQNIEASLTYGEATVSISYQITPRELAASMVTISSTSATYNGTKKTATVTVRYNSSTTLTAGTHYDVTGTTAATEIGTYTVTVTGKGNYTGTIEKTWKINKGSIRATISIEGWFYLDTPKVPTVSQNPENGEVTYTYYTSSGRKPTMTGTANGAENEGGVPTYAGTYYVGAVIAETEHYRQTTITPSSTTEFVISPRKVSNPTFEGLQTSYPYDNGNEIKPTFTLKDDLGNIIPESEYTVTYSDHTEAGTATIIVRDNENGNYTVSGTATFDISTHDHEWKYTAEGSTITATCTGTIGTCPIATVTITAENTTYNGTAQETATVAYSEGWNSGELTVSYANNTNAGTATASITVGEATASVEFTIAKAEIDGLTLINPEFAEGLVYNGTAQALVTQTGSVNGGTIVYSLSPYGEYTETIPVATETGTYVVYWMIKGDENHNDGGNPGDAYTTVYIAKANPEYTIPTGLTATYGDTLANVVLPDGWTWKDAETTSVGNAGTRTFKAVFTPADTGNYNTVETDVTVEVAKVDPEFTVPAGLTATYGNTLADVELPAGWTWKDAETTSVGNAGTNAFQAIFTPADTTNYTVVESGVTITVGKATVTITLNPMTQYYGEKSPPLTDFTYTVEGLIGEDTLNITGYWIDTDGDVGVYEINPSRIVVSDNYETVLIGANLTILPREIPKDEIKIKIEQDNIVYDGTAKTPTVKVYDSWIDFGDRELTEGTDYEVSYSNNTYVGTATVTITFKGNYTGSARSATFTIVRAAAPAIQWPTAGSLTYGQKLSESTLTSEDANGTFAWENGEQIPTVTNSGYVVVYTPKDTVNYDYSGVTLTQTIPVTVSKAPASVETAPAANTLIYTGEAQALVTAGAANNGEMQYSTDNQTWSTAIPKGTNAGEYTVYYKVVGDANHIDTDVQSVVVKIGQLAVAEPTVSGTYTYTGKEQMVTLTGVESYMTVVSGNKAVGAGSYEAVITLDGNHKWADGSDGKVQWSIGKAEFGDVYVSQSGMLTYNRTAQTPKVNTDADSEGDQTATFAYRLTENEPYGEMPAFTDAGTYTVYYKASAPNHKDATGSFTVMVDKAKAEITVDTDPITVTYGDTVELPDATANFGTVSCDKTAAELVNVGTYTVTYTVAGTDNYDGDTKTVTVKINPKAITEDDVQLNGSLVYTGSEQTQQITVTAGIDFEVTGNKATNVGSYTLTVTASGNYTGSVTKDWSIKAAAAIVETAPKANNLTYTGEAQELVTAGTAKGGKLVYSLTEDGEYTETIPAGTNVGEYTVWYYVDGDYNHSDSAKASVKVTIAKAKAEISVDTTPITVTYGETVELPNATSSFGTVSCDKTADELVNAGTYTVTYTVEGTDNYEGDTKTVTVTIEKLAVAEPTVTGTYTYTGEEQTAQLTGVESCMTVASGDKATNAGSYEAEITLDGNHQWAEGSDGKVQWSIGKAQAEIAVNTDPITAVYGGTVKLPEATANFGTVTCDTTADKLVNAGTYTVTYTVASTANFDGDSKTVTVTVNPKAITEADVSLNGSLVYTGSELTQAVTVTAGVTYEVTGNKATDVGTYELTVKATGNYTGEVSLTWSIKAAAATVVTAPRANTLTYTGEAQALVTAGTAKGGTVQYQLNGGAWSETIPTAKDEGTYTVSYKVAGDANHADTEPVALTVTIGDCTHAGNTNREDNDCTTEVTCSVCGDVLTEAKSHVWGDWVVTLDPTTTAEGAKERSCTNSGCKAKDTESIPMLNEVAVPEVSGGDVTVDNDTPATGDDVTVTVTPETGREVESITVTDKDGNEIEVTENEDGTYTYEQPQGDVTIEVTLKDTIYTVKWMVDGAVYKTAQYKYGETITAPAAPGKAQSGCTTYTFEKWDGFTACMTMPDDAELTFTAVFAQGESHVDEDTDHICDRECGKQGMGDHVDGDLDHACDYGCEEPIGEHKDADTDHVCDYGCKVAIGTCEDTDKDHACDYGCGKVYGEHSDSDNDQDHKCDYCGEPMPKDGIQVEIPTDDTGTIIPGAPAEIDGKPIVIDWDGEIWLEDKNSKILVTYKFNEDEDPHKEYPTAMYAWYLKWTGDTCEAIRVPELDNFMTYKGTSIRVGHSSDGIRFFTAVPVDALNKVMAGTLLTGELEGYKLVEMGTLYKWAATGTELTIENGAKSYVYGGSAGSTYRQFSKEGDLSWFTGMLTDLPGDAQTLAKDILSRPYAVFQKGNDTIVLYGGSIQRSIYYVALQNKDTWATGTAYDNYVEKIISTVDAANG